MSLVAKSIAYGIVVAALTISPHALVSTDVAPRAEAATPGDAPQTDKEKIWAEADLVCEIHRCIWAIDIDLEPPERTLLVQGGTGPSVRPGGRDIAFVRGNDIWLYLAEDGSEKKIAEDALEGRAPEYRYHRGLYGYTPMLLGKLAWHPDGRFLAYSTWQKVTWQAHPAVEKAHPFYETPDGRAPDEFWFQSLRLLDTQTGACCELVGPEDDTEWGVMVGASAPAWDPDGERLAYIRGGDVWELNSIRLPQPRKPYTEWRNRRLEATGNLAYAQAGSPRSVGAIEVCYTPDGERIIASLHRLRASDSTRPVIVEVPKTPEEKRPAVDAWLKEALYIGVYYGFYHNLTLSADGRRLAYALWSDVWVCEAPAINPRMVVKGGTCPSWIEVGHE